MDNMNNLVSAHNSVDFENTEIGFGYKTDRALKRARLLFLGMNYPWLVKLGTSAMLFAIEKKLPVKWVIENTLFKQFVGGQSLTGTRKSLKVLERNNVQAILDYGVEGKESEESFEAACEEFLKLTTYAADIVNVPFISIKITGIGRFGLLEKVSALLNVSGYEHEPNLDSLLLQEKLEWQSIIKRLVLICEAASHKKVGILVDAEETWIQPAINFLTEEMMQKYNRERPLIYNTVQFYTKSSLSYLQDSFERAIKGGYFYGVKIVRGAYMEKERLRADEMGYACPIQEDKTSTDHDFNEGLKFCIKNISKIAVVIATHNEQSNYLALDLLSEYNIDCKHPHIHFSQLLGMSDNITFNLSQAGYQVSKYLPYGPINDVVPYLIRRAQENTSVSGQTSRELFLIKKEIKRRRLEREL